MTGPEVLISGDDDPSTPQLPTWLRRGVPALVVAALLVALGIRIAHDQHRHDVALSAADDVEAVVRINESGVGADSTVLIGVQVSGRGAPLQVDLPRLRPPQVARVGVLGAPTVVDAGSGNQIRMRLVPDCARAPTLAALGVDLPVTPTSGRQHVLRLPFPDGPALIRRACGYLPVDEALTTMALSARPDGAGRLEVEANLRNDGRDRLTVTGVRSPGVAVEAQLPITVLRGVASTTLPMSLRVTDCSAVQRDPIRESAVLLQVANGTGQLAEVGLQVGSDVAAAYVNWLAQVCD